MAPSKASSMAPRPWRHKLRCGFRDEQCSSSWSSTLDETAVHEPGSLDLEPLNMIVVGCFGQCAMERLGSRTDRLHAHNRPSAGIPVCPNNPSLSCFHQSWWTPLCCVTSVGEVSQLVVRLSISRVRNDVQPAMDHLHRPWVLYSLPRHPLLTAIILSSCSS